MGQKQDPQVPGDICSLAGKEQMSKGAAKSQAKRSAKRSHGNVVAYKCRTCGSWHVGNVRRFA